MQQQMVNERALEIEQVNNNNVGALSDQAERIQFIHEKYVEQISDLNTRMGQIFADKEKEMQKSKQLKEQVKNL